MLKNLFILILLTAIIISLSLIQTKRIVEKQVCISEEYFEKIRNELYYEKPLSDEQLELIGSDKNDFSSIINMISRDWRVTEVMPIEGSYPPYYLYYLDEFKDYIKLDCEKYMIGRILSFKEGFLQVVGENESYLYIIKPYLTVLPIDPENELIGNCKPKTLGIGTDGSYSEIFFVCRFGMKSKDYGDLSRYDKFAQENKMMTKDEFEDFMAFKPYDLNRIYIKSSDTIYASDGYITYKLEAVDENN